MDGDLVAICTSPPGWWAVHDLGESDRDSFILFPVAAWVIVRRDYGKGVVDAFAPEVRLGPVGREACEFFYAPDARTADEARESYIVELTRHGVLDDPQGSD